MCGEAAFVDANCIEVTSRGDRQSVKAEYILLAPGTRPTRPSHIPFNGETVFDSDEILNLGNIPRSMIVVGGGVIGLEYAIMFATLGVQVTVVDGRSQLLEFCDHEIIDTLLHHARSLGMMFRLGESVVEIHEPKPGLVAVELESGKRLLGETVLFSVGRVGDTAPLRLDRAGLEADDRGRLSSNEHFQTNVPHIYAVGDVVGFPALASTAMEQGRRAVCHMVGKMFEPCRNMPYGLFTIPEISMVGQNEAAAHQRPRAVRSGHRALRRDRPRPDRGRPHRHAQAAVPSRIAQAAGRACDRRIGHGDYPHRPGRDGARRHDRLLPRHGVQLPDDGRVLQSRGARRTQQAVAVGRDGKRVRNANVVADDDMQK